MFHLAVDNHQCKHVLFGCTHDQRFVETLKPYADNPIASTSITLINSGDSNSFLPFQTMPFEVIDLTSTFQYAENANHHIMSGGFHPSQMPRAANPAGDRQLQNSQKPPPFALDGQIDEESQEHATPTTEWIRYAGGTIVRPAGRASTSANMDLLEKYSSWEETTRSVLLNVDNQRIDKELPQCDPQALNRITKLQEEQRFCACYFLLANCASKDCNYRHTPDLSNEELLVLRHWMRRQRCPSRMECLKSTCFLGHICPYLPNCSRGRSCAFSKTHDIDRTVVKVLPAE